MRREIRVPFLRTLSPGTLEPWQLGSGDHATMLPEEHLAWDPTIDLEVSRRVAIDTRRLVDDCALGSNAAVRIVGGWECESSRARHYPWRSELKVPARFDGSVAFTIPGALLASSVKLMVGIVLVDAGRASSSLAARTPGSLLWRDERELRLEVSSGRFPMEWTDFARSGLAAAAPWFLDWPSQDWDRPLLGSMRLRLNATNPTMRGLLELPEADERRALLIRAALLDVSKQIVVAALDSEEFVQAGGNYGEGSVGMSASILIGLAFPGVSLETVRSRMHHQAGEFHMRLQAAVVPFTEVS